MESSSGEVLTHCIQILDNGSRRAKLALLVLTAFLAPGEHQQVKSYPQGK